MASSHKGTHRQAKPKSEPDTPGLPAHEVWLVGLEAMAKAQEQGSKALETLVNDGLAFQRKSQAQAQQRLQEVSARLGHMASDMGQQATGQVDKLEHLFEDRVAKALRRLGMPTLLDIQMLNDRVTQLQVQLSALLDAGKKKSTSTPNKAPRTASGKTARSRPASPRTARPARKAL